MSKAKQTIPAGRPGIPNPVDMHVGGRVRMRRKLFGISQSKLAEELGVTFQQVQKYERGTNRVGASRLFDIARILNTPIGFFFEDMPNETANQSPRLRAGLSDVEAIKYEQDPMGKRETLELVKNYYRIKDPKMRKLVFDLCKSISSDTTGPKSD
jgi:transcriptional regulator with XRE-family HTH domain